MVVTERVMREFTFDIVCNSVVNPVMDVFIDAPDLTAHSLHCCISGDHFWRVERLTGPSAALDEVERLRFDETVPPESITETDCKATCYYDVLERRSEECVLYSYLSKITGGESIHTLAGKYLPNGSILQSRQRSNRQEWRILMRTDEKVGLLYDSLSANLRDGLVFEMGHLRDAEGWQAEMTDETLLSPDQRAALRAAAAYGYYRTPREVTLEELASELDLPRSTLSYRLQRAEEIVVADYLEP